MSKHINKTLSSILTPVRRLLSRKDSRTSVPTQSQQQKKVYLHQGILENNQDFAERMLRRMQEEGIFPPGRQ
jgi:hypothetical protein